MSSFLLYKTVRLLSGHSLLLYLSFNYPGGIPESESLNSRLTEHSVPKSWLVISSVNPVLGDLELSALTANF